MHYQRLRWQCEGWEWSLLDEREGLTDPASVSEFWRDEQNYYLIVLHISVYPARALRALGLLLADGAPTVGGGRAA